MKLFWTGWEIIDSPPPPADVFMYRYIGICIRGVCVRGESESGGA